MTLCSLIAVYLHEADGAFAVALDVATERLETALSKLPSATPIERRLALDHIAELLRPAERDLDRAMKSRVKAAQAVHDTKQHAARSSGEVAKQAYARLAALQLDAHAIAEEVAEYRATVIRLEEVRALIEAIK